ncbi:carbohydrate ABC transporter permease [Paenibacillus sp. J5C_2022]|uniref:carbohydrate ABC transporter permease n=1 Tax=Paenibacillus sp. J5C2022 TaxID=2977129 RepID=UPI0021D1B259|nr:carbohydrate ABC transporter permease [Paenibacillus sp. J5C2022]MCU6712811.1 carbohydrate ABC transporter permease [Paenibacillus sp. J5C2022]
MQLQKTIGERLSDLFIIGVNLLVIVVTLYPFLYVLSMSISDPVFAMRKEVYLFPKGFSVEAYGIVFENPDIWIAYYNTLWYTIVGTSISVVVTVMAAYPLSRSTFFARNPLMFFFAFTMFFTGGLIPTYIIVNSLNLYDTRWAVILPGAISAFNIIIARTFFQSIPESLQESAKIDGANEARILWSIMLPLSKPITAVLVLFYAVGYWNNYFSSLIYLSNAKLQPLQLYLFKILVKQQDSLMEGMTDQFERALVGTQVKYAAIMVTILPIICLYPFLQKYFVKGVMIGAVKE